jgi:ribosomal protein L39E
MQADSSLHRRKKILTPLKFLCVILNKAASSKQNLAYAENYNSSIPAFIYWYTSLVATKMGQTHAT